MAGRTNDGAFGSAVCSTWVTIKSAARMEFEHGTVAVAAHYQPVQPVEPVLQAAGARVIGPDVLDEQKAAAGAQHHLAAVLGVNTNTVLQALRMLRDEGLLEMGRARAIVVGTPERSAIVTKMNELLELGRRNGYRREELVEMFQALPG